MSAEHYSYVEQDQNYPSGGNELPTYDDLAQQNGPNSRFGRWRGWIEKRAAERYADITPEERARRRARGWGNEDEDRPQPTRGDLSTFAQTGTSTVHEQLHIRTTSLSIQDSPLQSVEDVSSISLPFVSETIEGSRLKINHFGSRFLPHTSRPIRCVLPLQGDRMLLVGHDDGLSVLDLFPQEWTENGEIATTGPGDAHCWPIWEGETVYQMSLLEVEDNGSGVLQGVVLAIVGPSSDTANPGKETEMARTARMYNLTSLINLAKWTISQKGAKPLDLSSVSSLQVPNSPRRHRPHGSIARSLKSLAHPHIPTPEATQSYQNLYPPPSTGSTLKVNKIPSETGEPTLAPNRRHSGESGWDVVEDTALRWATDFRPLAAAGSRSVGFPVLCFATWSDETRKGKGTGGQLLAVATKNNVVLYETPKGERSYRFVKEFYTPFQPRSLTFVHQAFSDGYRSPVEVGPSGRLYSHRRANSNNGALKGVVNGSSSNMPLRFGTHLSLFVVFDKKAGVIRLADANVEEVELGEDGSLPTSSGSASGLLHPTSSFSSSTPSLRRQRARLSFEIRESASKWIAPVRCELPVAGFSVDQGITEPVHILTLGKRTHVVPCPLPSRNSMYSPLHAVFWRSHPKYVSARVIVSESDLQADAAVLQLVSFSDNGIEVHETGLGFMRKGKGRAAAEEVVQVEEDIGESGFLGCGGNWDRMDQVFSLNGQGMSMTSAMSSAFSIDSMDSSELLAYLKREEGIYGWYRKDLEDWRIFWVGGR